MLGHSEHEHGLEGLHEAAPVEEAPRIDHTKRSPMWDQDGVHEVYRAWRRILESYGTPDRILCAEAWVEPQERAVAYVRPDEMHQAFNFDFLTASWTAEDLRTVITSSLHAADSVGAPSTWVLSNHDVVRHASRLGFAPGTPRMNGIAATDPQPDREARPASGAGRHGAHARTARRRVHLPGRGASACPTPPTCRPSSARTPPSRAPTVPRPAATAAASRSRGPPTARRSASAPATARGCRSPTSTPTTPSTARRVWPARPSRLYRALLAARREPVPRDRLAHVGRGVCRRRRRADQRLLPAWPGPRRREPRGRARRPPRGRGASSWPPGRSRTVSSRPTRRSGPAGPDVLTTGPRPARA